MSFLVPAGSTMIHKSARRAEMRRRKLKKKKKEGKKIKGKKKGFTPEISTKTKHEAIVYGACAIRCDQAWSLRDSKPWNRTPTRCDVRDAPGIRGTWIPDEDISIYLWRTRGSSLENANPPSILLYPPFELRIPIRSQILYYRLFSFYNDCSFFPLYPAFR